MACSRLKRCKRRYLESQDEAGREAKIILRCGEGAGLQEVGLHTPGEQGNEVVVDPAANRVSKGSGGIGERGVCALVHVGDANQRVREGPELTH